MNRSFIRFSVAALAACFSSLHGQFPDELAHTILAPVTGLQSDVRQGEAVASNADFLVVGAPDEDVGAVDSGVVRVYDPSTGALLLTIPNPLPGSISRFGSQLALSGDRLVAGRKPTPSISGPGYGSSVFIFDLASATPTVPTLVFEAPSFSGFGAAFAIDGDRLVISDTGTSNSDAGMLHVYDLGGASPLTETLTIAAPAGEQNIGKSLALDNNLLVAGSRLSSAWVYDLDAATPETPIAELFHTLGVATETSVDINDPYVVVGTPLVNSKTGAAYLFDLDSGLPSIPILAVSQPTPSTFDEFGADVAIASKKFVVSSREDGTNAEGIAYVFDLLSPTPLTPIHTIENPEAGTDGDFGASLALTGAQLLVGVPGSDADVTNGGRAYTFQLNATTPEDPVLELNESGPETSKKFGQAVRFSSPYLAVGAPFQDAGEIDAGSVDIFDLEGASPTVPDLSIPHPDPEAGAQFGQIIDLHERYLAVGAPDQDLPSQANAGEVYIFDLLGASRTTPIHTLTPATPDDEYPFGEAVALNDDWIVVGAPKTSSSFFGSGQDGKVFIYDFASPTSPVFTLVDPTSNAFGGTIALDGDRLAVGAVDGDGANYDKIYIYDLGAADPTVPLHTLPNPNPTAPDPFTFVETFIFGSSIALSGDWLAVGGDDSAYLYDLSAADPVASVVPVVFTTTNWAGDDVPVTGLYEVALSGELLTVSNNSSDRIVNAYDLSLQSPFSNPASIVPGIADLNTLSNVALAMEGPRTAVGTPSDGSSGIGNGAVYVFDRSPTPEISVQAKGEELESGVSSVRIGLGTIGVPTAPVVVTIRNVGGATLGGLSVSKTGLHAAEFILKTDSLPPSLAPDTQASFIVTFTAAGTSFRQAQLEILSNDADEKPFLVEVLGWSLSALDDTDKDGLNDLAEWTLAPLGFDWQRPQPALVGLLLNNANLADLFTSDQIGALSVNGVLERNPTSDNFLLRIGVRKSIDHETYDPLPMTEGTTQINPSGELEFEFTVPEDTAFFELEAN